MRIILRAEAEMVVHRYRPLSDGRLRVSWRPVFRSGSGETLDAGEEPSTESVRAQDVILIVQLHDGGVLSHAAARSLDKAGWRLDETDMEFEADLVHGPSDQSAARLEALVGAVQGGLLSPDGHFVLEDRPLRGSPGRAEFPPPAGIASRRQLCFQFGTEESQRAWLADRAVDFVEVFSGCGELSRQVAQLGLKVADGLDRCHISYGRAWHWRQPRVGGRPRGCLSET